jgi:hypothetical protein
VAISGNTVVAGAPFATVDSNTLEGQVGPFVEPPAAWTDSASWS